MSKTTQDRIPVDITGMRERIDQAYDSSAWKELAMSKKIRVLAEERLAQLETEKNKFDESK